MPFCYGDLKSLAFMSGCVELYDELYCNPELRMVSIDKLDTIRNGLHQLGYKFRIRYRGPHRWQRDTLKRNARAFTVYITE